MDIHSVPIRGTPAAYWDKLTWTVLEDLARNHPDVGVRFQECEIHSRAKDVGTTTAKWFAELLYTDPWFKDVVPNVSGRMEALVLVSSNCISSAHFLKNSYTPTTIPLRLLLQSA